jgi:hypothetical protein
MLCSPECEVICMRNAALKKAGLKPGAYKNVRSSRAREDTQLRGEITPPSK